MDFTNGWCFNRQGCARVRRYIDTEKALALIGSPHLVAFSLSQALTPDSDRRAN